MTLHLQLHENKKMRYMRKVMDTQTVLDLVNLLSFMSLVAYVRVFKYQLVCRDFNVNKSPIPL